jgi:hypothetical protein
MTTENGNTLTTLDLGQFYLHWEHSAMSEDIFGYHNYEDILWLHAKDTVKIFLVLEYWI